MASDKTRNLTDIHYAIENMSFCLRATVRALCSTSDDDRALLAEYSAHKYIEEISSLAEEMRELINSEKVVS